MNKRQNLKMPGMGSKETLSLVAAFDDLVRNTTVLTTGIESEFIVFAKNQEDCRKKWLEAEEGSSSTNSKVRKLEKEKQTLETLLKHARTQIEWEMERRIKAEQERDSMSRQLALIRELLMKDKNTQSERVLSYITTKHDEYEYDDHDHEHDSRHDRTTDTNKSVVLDSSRDYTADDLEAPLTKPRPHKRAKSPSAPPPEDSTDSDGSSKRPRMTRNKGDANTSITATTTIEIPPRGPMIATSKIETDTNKSQRHRRTKSNTEDTNQNNNYGHPRGILRDRGNMESHSQTNHVANTPPSPSSPIIRSLSSAGRLNKGHLFATKTFLKLETCGVCNKRIAFGGKALKCQHCHTTSHIDCKEKVPLPCVPNTPGGPRKEMGILGDYVSGESPMVPALVIHCIGEIESRGLTERGIYRESGSAHDVKELKEKFLKRRGIPRLCAIDDVHVICGCIKSFFIDLKEPLVTYDLWKDFVHASQLNDKDEALCHVYQAVSELPQANRDTLAYMILHLKRVSESEECKMTVKNISRVLGPTLIGYSSPRPDPSETVKQIAVMELLLSITSDYWNNFINTDDDAISLRSLNYMRHADVRTPELRVPSSMLGPVNGSTTKRGNDTVTPRPSRTRTGPRHFFSSPTLN